MMANYPLLENKPDKLKRKKAMCTKWDEMEGNESRVDSDSEEAMLC